MNKEQPKDLLQALVRAVFAWYRLLPSPIIRAFKDYGFRGDDSQLVILLLYLMTTLGVDSEKDSHLIIEVIKQLPYDKDFYELCQRDIWKESQK